MPGSDSKTESRQPRLLGDVAFPSDPMEVAINKQVSGTLEGQKPTQKYEGSKCSRI